MRLVPILVREDQSVNSETVDDRAKAAIRELDAYLNMKKDLLKIADLEIKVSEEVAWMYPEGDDPNEQTWNTPFGQELIQALSEARNNIDDSIKEYVKGTRHALLPRERDYQMRVRYYAFRDEGKSHEAYGRRLRNIEGQEVKREDEWTDCFIKEQSED